MKDLREVARNDAASNGDPGLTALRNGAALAERTGRCILRLTGKDPLGMLSAILTNSIPTEDDRGAYALLLNPKGRVQTDLRVLKSADGVLVDTEPEGADAARETLGRYAPFSRVRLEDLSGTWSILGLYGPHARELLEGLDLAEHGTTELSIGDEDLLVAGVAAPVAGHDLIGPSEAVANAREHLASRGAVPVNPDAYETVRVEAGVPRFGADLTPENFPGEVDGVLERAVDFAKGCYPGQETVARMRYRGHPNKTLYRISAASDDLTAGTTILQEGKPVGTVTSVAPISSGGETFALCYLSRRTNLDRPLTAREAEVRVLAG